MIWSLVAEVFNGTFAQYFSNETGDHALQALDGLKKCGANEGARFWQEAMDLFQPYGGYTTDRDIRNDRIVAAGPVSERSRSAADGSRVAIAPDQLWRSNHYDHRPLREYVERQPTNGCGGALEDVRNSP